MIKEDMKGMSDVHPQRVANRRQSPEYCYQCGGDSRELYNPVGNHVMCLDCIKLTRLVFID